MGLNEIMGTEMGAVEKYDNYTFVEGEVLTVSGANIQLVGELPATEAIPAYDVTETATHNTEAEGQTTTCTTDVSGDVETVDCKELQGHDELKADLEAQVNQ